jgi:hypothetical protein
MNFLFYTLLLVFCGYGVSSQMRSERMQVEKSVEYHPTYNISTIDQVSNIQGGKSETPRTPKLFWSTSGVQWSTSGVQAEYSGVRAEYSGVRVEYEWSTMEYVWSTVEYEWSTSGIQAEYSEA